MNIQEIEKWAFLKYRLSGKKTMNTFVFQQAKKNKLTDEEIEKLLNKLNKKIEKYEKEEISKEDFTCNI